MFKSSNIRSLKLSDLAKLKVILDQTELFPSEMLEEMANPFFHDSVCTDFWQVYEHNGETIGFLYCVQERLTEGTWNVLAIAVLPEFQHQGIGGLLMSNIEQILQSSNSSTLLVETSSLPEYGRTRKFYDSIGYHKEAVIRDFYAKGEDKIVFWKSLN
ncbi:MAG: GNAT family N-acetyltransferase [Cellvibrionaceae bacterium]